MPKLKQKSTLNEKETPFTHKWDSAMRENHQYFQDLIDKETYEIQRGPKGIPLFGSWTFPYTSQKTFLRKDLYSKYQQLGKIFDEEVEEYSKFNPEIRNDLKHTFKTADWSTREGFFTGIGLNVIAYINKANFSTRLGLLILPMAYQYVSSRTRIEPQFHSLEFLDWCVSQRVCKARAEMDGEAVLEGIKGARSVLLKENPDVDIKQAYLGLFHAE